VGGAGEGAAERRLQHQAYDLLPAIRHTSELCEMLRVLSTGGGTERVINSPQNARNGCLPRSRHQPLLLTKGYLVFKVSGAFAETITTDRCQRHQFPEWYEDKRVDTVEREDTRAYLEYHRRMSQYLDFPFRPCYTRNRRKSF
jgi:hypothetical protein